MTSYQYLNLATLEEITRGHLRRGAPADQCPHDELVRHVASDSRHLLAGDVFWALRGARHDGARFVTEAFRRGAAGAVTQATDIFPPPGRWILEVDDTLAALWQLAAWKRRQFAGQVVAVTGSAGKSTTRKMLDAILRQTRQGIASPRNFNNHVGLPLSMLELGPDVDYALFELGASQPGEIGLLAGLCRPQVGIITSAGDAHLGTFGGYEAVALAKRELLDHLPPDGIAVLNGDCPRLRRVAADWKGRVVWFGRSPGVDVVPSDVAYTNGRLSFRIGADRYCVPVWGRHYLAAALAALTAARQLGATTEEIGAGLAEFAPLPQRSNVRRVGEITVIDDTYNASPAAVQAALALLRETTTGGRRIAVLGDMQELGSSAGSLHRLIGEMTVTTAGCDLLIGCGALAHHVAYGARSAGAREDCVHACRGIDEAQQTLLAVLEPGDVVLLKGSRAAGLERIVAALEEEARRVAPQVVQDTYRTFGTPSHVPSLRELGTAHPPG